MTARTIPLWCSTGRSPCIITKRNTIALSNCGWGSTIRSARPPATSSRRETWASSLATCMSTTLASSITGISRNGTCGRRSRNFATRSRPYSARIRRFTQNQQPGERLHTHLRRGSSLPPHRSPPPRSHSTSRQRDHNQSALQRRLSPRQADIRRRRQVLILLLHHHPLSSRALPFFLLLLLLLLPLLLHPHSARALSPAPSPPPPPPAGRGGIGRAASSWGGAACGRIMAIRKCGGRVGCGAISVVCRSSRGRGVERESCSVRHEQDQCE